MKKIMLFLCAGALLSAQSCKKDDKNDTNTSKSDMLKGSWTLSQFGGDANSNQKLDANEAADVSLTGMSGTLTLNSDGTGSTSITITGDPESEDFKWFLEGDNTVKTVDNANTNDTTTYFIAELTSSRFVALSGQIWTVWKK